MKEETCMLQDEINQKEKGCLQVAARSASRTFCSAKPAGGLRHMQISSHTVACHIHYMRKMINWAAVRGRWAISP